MNSKDHELVDRFVASFTKLDDLDTDEVLDPVGWQLRSNRLNEFGIPLWRPAKRQTDPLHIQPLYAQLPARFPPLYEHLVLNYRWADVDLRSFTLLANPPADNLVPLLDRLSRDKYMWPHLIRGGFIQFGKGPDIDYDPVCFDLSARRQNGDLGIVKLDHEEILCHDRLRVVEKIANSFRDLVIKTIALADGDSAKH